MRTNEKKEKNERIVRIKRRIGRGTRNLREQTE
jgi:hypothetical protein